MGWVAYLFARFVLMISRQRFQSYMTREVPRGGDTTSSTSTSTSTPGPGTSGDCNDDGASGSVVSSYTISIDPAIRASS